MDAPLSLFTTSSRRKRRLSRRPVKEARQKVGSSPDDSCLISDDDVPLSGIKRRCTLRSRHRIDYSGLDWTDG
ncbi:hypothetical protein TELCIR_23046 [Teladorsagia circumcincta]|uniref:Uncharacterized protein n=1 Tax=Teladorsagia circumcincta TaxID=45464 RepID=A0A2G9TC80_TELCI|nr:hypothetical protein TELCIR_23046 [Teladorsagia circumcincta]